VAITFLEKRKRLKSLIPIFVIIIFIIGIVIWRGFFAEEKLPALEEILKPAFKELKIDFPILESPGFEEFQLFEKTLPFEGETGRENPFIPY